MPRNGDVAEQVFVDLSPVGVRETVMVRIEWESGCGESQCCPSGWALEVGTYQEDCGCSDTVDHRLDPCGMGRVDLYNSLAEAHSAFSELVIDVDRVELEARPFVAF